MRLVDRHLGRLTLDRLGPCLVLAGLGVDCGLVGIHRGAETLDPDPIHLDDGLHTLQLGLVQLDRSQQCVDARLVNLDRLHVDVTDQLLCLDLGAVLLKP